ncbi:peptidoglycan recognition protein [Streptomyces spiramyceticus]|uniref:peptidoglycan recognition protein family protein n=1 Tax=Streptomyces spiramyceticus TaxID=299717 RepID=UPI00237A60BA|nr:peptidoglycan recognition protein [Streptomyces spiramyceticus]
MRVFRVALCCAPGASALGLLLLCATGVEPAVSGVRAGDQHSSLMPAAAAPVRRISPHLAPYPSIVPRSKWLARDTYRRPPARFADRIEAVFVHHTNSPNGYDCADVPRIIRTVYRGQAGARHWDDIGYNFLVDRCGTIYEGRAGGVDQPVVGAHAQGFNRRTVGIAAIGRYTEGMPVPQRMIDAIAAIVAWKLGVSDIDPRSRVRLESSNSLSKYRKGTTPLFYAVSGHSDGYRTICPGSALMAELPAIREIAARLQGR